MKLVAIVGRPSFDLLLLRRMTKASKNLDLSTATKGQLESLAVLSKLTSVDEYTYTDLSTKQMNFTFLIYSEVWMTKIIYSMFDRCTFYMDETINRNIDYVLMTGRLSDVVDIVKKNSVENCPVLKLMNELQEVIEAEGYAQLFKGHSKTVLKDCFYLERK